VRRRRRRRRRGLCAAVRCVRVASRHLVARLVDPRLLQRRLVELGLGGGEGGLGVEELRPRLAHLLLRRLGEGFRLELRLVDLGLLRALLLVLLLHLRDRGWGWM